MTIASRTPSRRPGLTLAALAIAIAIVGVIAALGIPILIRSAERARVAEAFDYASLVQSAQERSQARSDTYAARISDLDIDAEPPASFHVAEAFKPGATGSLRDSWTLTLTRRSSLAHYGAYTMVFRDTGYDPAASNVPRPLTVGIDPSTSR